MEKNTLTRRGFLRDSALTASALSLPAQSNSQTPDVVYTFDAMPLRQLDLREEANIARAWDTMHLLAALQGLANRYAPRLYLFYCTADGIDTDRFWFDWLRQEDGWLARSTIKPLRDLKDALETFRESYAGLVVYDPAVPATSNVASTAAGAGRLLPVRYDPAAGSVFTLLSRELRIPIKLRLLDTNGSSLFTGKGMIPSLGEPSSGSAKVDACRWAVRQYLQTGECDPRVLAYYIDAFWMKLPRQSGPDLHTLSNHDYFIARKAFFFDLSPWGDEVPNDDPGQPLGADRKEFLHVLATACDKAGGTVLKVGGFPPWPFKYTDAKAVGGKHPGVPTEWEFGRLISQYNGYMEADAASLSAMANASFYRHYPLAARYPQPNRKPGMEDWKARGYIDADGKVAAKTFLGHYVGDYDAPSWLYKTVPLAFADPARGEIPLAWAFDPNLADRAPQALVYAYRNATSNDFFIAGDSGAGYLNPRSLTVRPDSGLRPGLEAWVKHCRAYYERWGMTITGFVLDGSGGASTDVEFEAYRRFSPDGLGTHFEPGAAIHAGVPTCRERDLPNGVDQAADAIARDAAKGSEPVFLWKRSVLRRPSWYSALSKTLKAKYPQLAIEVVDPYTFFGLIKLHLVGRA
jgi:hypothetical protein